MDRHRAVAERSMCERMIQLQGRGADIRPLRICRTVHCNLGRGALCPVLRYAIEITLHD